MTEKHKGYEVRKMSVWQRLHVIGLHGKLKDDVLLLIGEIIRHGIKSYDGVNCKEERITLPNGKTCTVLTDATVDAILQSRPLEDPQAWDDVIMDIYEVNKFPFFKDTESGGQG